MEDMNMYANVIMALRVAHHKQQARSRKPIPMDGDTSPPPACKPVARLLHTLESFPWEQVDETATRKLGDE